MKTPTLYCDDGSEIELPFKWIICDACRGHGKSSAYLGAFTPSDIDQMDRDFIEDYFAGRYDRACDACGGSGKVKIADTSRMTKAQREQYRDQRQADRDIRAIERQERLMEGGWRELNWYGEHGG